MQDFEARMLERYPKAELLRFLSAPSDEIKNSSKQCMTHKKNLFGKPWKVFSLRNFILYCMLQFFAVLQICDVKPVMGSSNSKRMSAMKNADECVRLYYKSNDIEK